MSERGGNVVPFPEKELSRDELHRLAAEAEILIEDTQRALEVAKGIRMYYLRRLGMAAMEHNEPTREDKEDLW